MKHIWIAAALALLLGGCGAKETLETVADDISVQPVPVSPREISVRLPDNAVAPVLDSDSEQVYLCEDYEIVIETHASGDLSGTIAALSGFEPDVDIPIVYTGLRPGEKLFEECLKEEEGLQKTANDLIFIGKPLEFDEEAFFTSLDSIKKTVDEDSPEVKEIVKKMVPSYH